MWKNSSTHYGLLARLFHWLMVPLVIGLIILGLWMTSLGYYDPWYHRAPTIHEGLGMIVFLLLVMRLIYRQLDPPPLMVESMQRWEKRAAHLTHMAFYVLMTLLPFTGYLIVTAKGEPLRIFNWFDIPAIFAKQPNREDWAGLFHLTLGLTLAALIGLHMLAALKHHFINKDETLQRMVGSLPVACNPSDTH